MRGHDLILFRHQPEVQFYETHGFCRCCQSWRSWQGTGDVFLLREDVSADNLFGLPPAQFYRRIGGFNVFRYELQINVCCMWVLVVMQSGMWLMCRGGGCGWFYHAGMLFATVAILMLGVCVAKYGWDHWRGRNR